MLDISQMYFVKFDIFIWFILHERNVLENLEKVEPKKPSIVTFDTIPVIWIYKPHSEFEAWLHHGNTLTDEFKVEYRITSKSFD